MRITKGPGGEEKGIYKEQQQQKKIYTHTEKEKVVIVKGISPQRCFLTQK